MENSAHSGSGVRDPVHQPQFVLHVTCALMVKPFMTIQDNKTINLMVLRDDNWVFDIVGNGSTTNSPANSENVTFILERS